jgi:hypothetical protein
MPSTYEKIATNTLGSAASSVTFSSISSAYTDLVLIVSANGSVNPNYASIQFNADTSNKYSQTYLAGNGTSAVSTRTSSARDIISLGYTRVATAANTFSTYIANIQNYANTTTYKTTLIRAEENSVNYVTSTVGLYQSTSAITSIKVLVDTGNFSVGSTFTLYGIKAA